jgi:hypothetical protein
MCLFCEGICPTGAVEFKFQKRNQNAVKGDTGKGDPGKGMGDISLQLEFAEATGRFRRLLKREDVGPKNWEEVTGHPRHKELP